MTNQMLMYLMIVTGGLLGVIIIAFVIVNNKLKSKETKYIAQLVEGTKTKSFSADIFYQKIYISCLKIPILKRYVSKIRRRLEIINLEDEYLTRKQTAQIVSKGLLVIIPLTAIVVYLARHNTILMLTLFLFELFFIETFMESMVDKIDNQILKQQVDMFGEMRHSYHEYNMVEEALYEVAQNDEVEVSRQVEKIYEVLISDDPETELEKYYDIAPNSYLKEFAGVSYLTKEFGDRKDKDGASLYLKNLNNIVQEMQLEILKRDKLDYVFQSLSMIAAIPILFLDVMKNWAIAQFAFTRQFYNGTLGFLAQMAIVIITIVCYILVRTLKENGNTHVTQNTENPWQKKLYKKKPIKKFIDYIMPKNGTKEYRKVVTLLKDNASKLKIEWLYINRVTCSIVSFLAAMFIIFTSHQYAVNYVYKEPTSDYNLLGNMSEREEKSAMQKTQNDNVFLDKFKNDFSVTQKDLKRAIQKSEEYGELTEKEMDVTVQRIWDKLQIVQSQYLKWFELLISFIIAAIGYYGPIGLLMFQKKMRQMEMENEVMQFQTIILMLMKIERVNVEMILEWLERYANIFKEPISRCVNNFESGAWEALQELKNELTFTQLIRIVEGLQSAVESIPIREAFDELDTERAYYQEKRKESNERLISRKSMIGKLFGFAPMVVLFVGYLIVPLCAIGLISMTNAFNTMSAM